MDFWQVVGGSALGGSLAGSAIAIASKYLSDRSLEHLKSELAKELEFAKDALVTQGKLLQASIDRRQFVSRTRFEAEFDAMKNVYAVAAKMDLHLAGTRPMIESVPSHETLEERRNRYLERAQGLATAHDEAIIVIENLRPFYTERLHDELVKCCQAVRVELNQIRTGSNFDSPRWYDQAEVNRHKFCASYAEAQKLIRARVEWLSASEE